MQDAALKAASFAFLRAQHNAMKPSACRKHVGSRVRGSVKQTCRD